MKLMDRRGREPYAWLRTPVAPTFILSYDADSSQAAQKASTLCGTNILTSKQFN